VGEHMAKKWSELPRHADRMPQASGLRTAILGTIAENRLLEVRENMHALGYGLNVDTGGWIKRFFVEGLEWKAPDWERMKSGDSSEPEAKSMWCSAFACFCYLQGHAKEGAPLFLKREGRASGLRDNLIKAGLFIPMSSLYDGAKNPIATARLPGPGDFIVFPGHIGLLKSFNHAGKTLDSIEGNTYVDPRARQDGVYEIPGIKGRRFESIEGFGICDPIPCPGGACGWDMEH
jgi:hypothetical protein